jgi:calcium permeable stress-gated cation channel
MILTFSLLWFTYRYQMIYVSLPTAETNGLIFPKAINQLFTGLYFMELCLIGLFFLVRDEHNKIATIPQAIIMIVAFAGTIVFQILVNNAFGPLYTYLPITFEDEAVQRDEEFQRAQASRWGRKGGEEEDEDEDEGCSQHSLNEVLEQREKQEVRESKILEEQDLQDLKNNRKSGGTEMRNLEVRRGSENRLDVPQANDEEPQAERSRKLRASWADRLGARSRSHSHADAELTSDSQPRSQSHEKRLHSKTFTALTSGIRSGLDNTTRPIRDIEAQITPETYLFTDTQDALEDIEPEARQKIIKRAFQHPATRAIQPAVWIPHDEIGLTADEIQRTSRYTNNIWITSKNARLDAKCHVMFKGLPPDWDPFDNMDI